MLLLLLEWRDRLRHALRPAWLCPEQLVSHPFVAFVLLLLVKAVGSFVLECKRRGLLWGG